MQYYTSDADNRWNMDRIWFNVQVPKSKSNSHERYYISGSIYDLGTLMDIQEIGNKKD